MSGQALIIPMGHQPSRLTVVASTSHTPHLHSGSSQPIQRLLGVTDSRLPGKSLSRSHGPQLVTENLSPPTACQPAPGDTSPNPSSLLHPLLASGASMHPTHPSHSTQSSLLPEASPTSLGSQALLPWALAALLTCKLFSPGVCSHAVN